MATSAPAAPMIEVIDLRKTYSTRDDRIVTLDGVGFSVAAQEFVSLLGPSGCGKTTVLKIIASLVPASNGEVRVEETRVKGPQRKVGIVFQVPALMACKPRSAGCRDHPGTLRSGASIRAPSRQVGGLPVPLRFRAGHPWS